MSRVSRTVMLRYYSRRHGRGHHTRQGWDHAGGVGYSSERDRKSLESDAREGHGLTQAHSLAAGDQRKAE